MCEREGFDVQSNPGGRQVLYAIFLVFLSDGLLLR